MFVNTLHPDVMGRAFYWEVDKGMRVAEATYAFLDTQEYLSSPVVAVYKVRQPIRRRLADPDGPIDFPVLHELKDAGATDYVAFPLFFTEGTIHVATWSTKAARRIHAAAVR